MNASHPHPRRRASHVGFRLLCALGLACLASAASAALSPLQGAAQIAVGDSHACALLDGGRVKCWGNNELGQLGNDSTTHSDLPVDVAGLQGVIAIGAGYRHSCALLGDGTVKCWGKNFLGQLGDGTQTNRRTPVAVSGLSGASAIAVGGDHTCALTSAGARCWGYNGYGELGANRTDNIIATPTPVFGGQTYTSISAGYANTCALTAAGQAYCWGVYDRACNLYGCGFNYDIRPFIVDGLAGVTQISAGQYFNCARTQAGAVKCWGDNYHGQLGDLGTENPDPFLLIDIAGLGSGVAEVSAGYRHACARMSNGSLRCWGENGNGVLGDGSGEDAFPPVTVAGAADYLSVQAGGSLSCGRTNAAQARCWGGNTFGQLGDGEPWIRPLPVDVPGLPGLTAVASRAMHSCVLTEAGALRCWGSNQYGQLGNGSLVDSATPVAVSGLSSGVSAISVGRWHSCAVVNGAARCWGRNHRGQLGDGSQTDRSAPVAVSGLAGGVAEIAAGSEHSCARTSAGAARCWGANSDAQLGNGNLTSSTVPVNVFGLGNGVGAITVGDWHSCAITAGGSVTCWGRNDDGQLGLDNTDTYYVPQVLPYPADGATAIAAGETHTCLRRGNGQALCWGGDDDGQLGNGIGYGYVASPFPPQGLESGVVGVAAGAYHSCARMNDASLRCWGANFTGQLGDGSLSRRTTPTPVVQLGPVGTSVAAGALHTCALTASGALRCWGSNQYGQLGIGLRDYRRPGLVMVSQDLFRSGFEPGE